MNSAPLYEYLKKMVNIDDDAWRDLEARLQHKTIRRKDKFVTEGKVCKEVAFILSGSFRYYQTIDGKEITTFFSFEYNWVSAYNSFLKQQPSHVTVEAIENAEILVIQYNDLQWLYKHHPSIELFGRYIAEYLVSCLEERLHSMLLKTPEERYIKAIEDNGEHIHRIPQHYIASFLGITPESLSRIRKRRMQRVFS